MTHTFSEHRAVRLLAITFCVIVVVLLAAQHRVTQTHFPNLWSLSFVTPSDTSIDFVIHNQSPAAAFTYILTAEDHVLLSESLSIDPGTMQKISPHLSSDNAHTGKMTITVTDSSGQSKSIYKIFHP